MANITLIYKRKRDRNVALNYRPTSLISDASKILENITRDKFVNYLEENNILYNNTAFEISILA